MQEKTVKVKIVDYSLGILKKRGERYFLYSSIAGKLNFVFQFSRETISLFSNGLELSTDSSINVFIIKLDSGFLLTRDDPDAFQEDA